LQCRLDGDGDLEIVRVAGIVQAKPGDLTFVANAKYAADLATTRASAVILAHTNGATPRPPCAVLHTDDPYSTFARAVALFADVVVPPEGIDASSIIAPDATIGVHVSIGPLVCIGSGASIGPRTVIFPN